MAQLTVYRMFMMKFNLISLDGGYLFLLGPLEWRSTLIVLNYFFRCWGIIIESGRGLKVKSSITDLCWSFNDCLLPAFAFCRHQKLGHWLHQKLCKKSKKCRAIWLTFLNKMYSEKKAAMTYFLRWRHYN